MSSASDFELMLEMVVTAAEIEDGIAPARIAHNSQNGINLSLFAGVQAKPRLREPEWSQSELEFLIRNSDRMFIQDIATALGRTENGITVKMKRLNLKRISTAKTEYIVANVASKMLGVDSHKLCHWFDKGFIKGVLQPGERKIRLIKRVAFFSWACNPENWIYFDPHKVRDPHLFRLVMRSYEKWNDEWWSTAKVAEYHGVDAKTIMLYIKWGRLTGKQAQHSLSGRHPNQQWANWFIRKSEATRGGLVFWTYENPRPTFTPRALAWIVYAKDVLNMPWITIGRLMGRTWRRSRTIGPGVTPATISKHYSLAKKSMELTS